MKRLCICLFVAISLLFLTNTGNTKGWEYQNSGVDTELLAVDFVDAEYGWAVGRDKTVLFTVDGGREWQQVHSRATDCIPSTAPYLRTCDFHSVFFTDRKNGWVAGEVFVWGVSAEDEVSFPTRFGVILYTEDGGENWTCQYPCKVWIDIDRSNWPKVKGLRDLFFLNVRQGRAVGDGPYFLATSDGGRTWEERPIGFYAIPEIRHMLTGTKWVSPLRGWVSGFSYDMFSHERQGGLIAYTEDGGKTWRFEPFWPPTSAPVPPLYGIEVVGTAFDVGSALPPAWSCGDRGAIFHRVEEGWERQGFPWPFSLPAPDFRGLDFVDKESGWVVGGRMDCFLEDSSDCHPRPLMTIFHTQTGGERWRLDEWDAPGRLHDIDAVEGAHAWAVGTRGAILHHGNHVPEICRQWAEPDMPYAGESVDLFVSVKDLDGPDDIKTVTVDARSVGAGMVEMEPAWYDTSEEEIERRCVLYQGAITVSSLATYGLHHLPVVVVDSDGARATGQIELFVITSWVKIGRTWAEPNPVVQGEKVLLAAEVGIVAPKSPEGETILCPHNKVERVTVNITELLGVDCAPEMDCVIIVEMTDPDGDGVYTYVVERVTGGSGGYRLPVFAVDTLGHEDKSEIHVKVVDEPGCRFDTNGDGDVDGTELALLAEHCSREVDTVCPVKAFAGEFGRTDCGATVR